MTSISIVANTAILDFIRELSTSGDPSLQYIALSQVETWLVNQEWQKLRFVLRRLPLDIVPRTPEFLYVRAHIHWAAGNLDQAKNDFEKAKYYYRISAGDLGRAALCCLEIADIAHSRGAYAEATHYVDEAQALLVQLGVEDAYVIARQHLVRAVLTPFVSTHQESIQHARTATYLFRQLGDIVSEFMCTMAVASSAFIVGDFVEAVGWLEAAKRLYATGSVPTIYYARILNAEVHIHWFQGNFSRALVLGQQFYEFTEIHDTAHQHQRVYAAILLGNVQRALGNFTIAAEWYQRTREVVEAIGFSAYKPWVSLQEAWLCLLCEEYARSQEILELAVDQAVVSQWMSVRVVTAVLHLLTGDSTSAESLLTAALVYYQERGDEYAICALHCYLAYCSLQSADEGAAERNLDVAFNWLTTRNLCYVPHWWYPKFMARLCAYALCHCPAHTYTIHRMCVNHVGVAAVEPLMDMLKLADLAAKQRIHHVLDEIQQTHLSELKRVADPHIRQVLMELVASGQLVQHRLPLLMQKLITAEHRGQENPTLVAVFGLFVHGAGRAEIAERLLCSEHLVKNYISQIYEKFGLSYYENPRHHARKQRLQEIAQAEGFI